MSLHSSGGWTSKGVGRATFFLEENLFWPLLASGFGLCALEFLGIWQPHSSVCLCLPTAFPLSLWLLLSVSDPSLLLSSKRPVTGVWADWTAQDEPLFARAFTFCSYKVIITGARDWEVTVPLAWGWVLILPMAMTDR